MKEVSLKQKEKEFTVKRDILSTGKLRPMASNLLTYPSGHLLSEVEKSKYEAV